MDLTDKEQWVLAQLKAGHELHRRNFSRLYEVIKPNPYLARGAVMGTVNKAVLDRLTEKGLIKVGCPEGEFHNRYLITEKGQQAIQ